MNTQEQEALLIINPTAGRGRAGKEIRRVSKLLSEYGLTGQVWHHTRARGDAEHTARRAAAAGRRLIVAVGGDGTLHEVANGVLGSEATVGLIPFGTGNDFARALGLHGDLDGACRVVARGETRRIDMGVIEGAGTNGPRHFLVLTGTGYDAQTAQTVNSGIRFLSGPLAYVWGAILTLRTFTPFLLTIATDGGGERQLPAMFVSVANAETTGGGMKIAPGAQVDDGFLDICLVGAVSKPTLLWELTRIFDGKHVQNPAVTLSRAGTVTLTADPPQPLLIDGEVLGTTPARVSLLRHALAFKAAPR